MPCAVVYLCSIESGHCRHVRGKDCNRKLDRRNDCDRAKDLRYIFGTRKLPEDDETKGRDEYGGSAESENRNQSEASATRGLYVSERPNREQVDDDIHRDILVSH